MEGEERRSVDDELDGDMDFAKTFLKKVGLLAIIGLVSVKFSKHT